MSVESERRERERERQARQRERERERKQEQKEREKEAKKLQQIKDRLKVTCSERGISPVCINEMAKIVHTCDVSIPELLKERDWVEHGKKIENELRLSALRSSYISEIKRSKSPKEILDLPKYRELSQSFRESELNSLLFSRSGLGRGIWITKKLIYVLCVYLLVAYIFGVKISDIESHKSFVSKTITFFSN